MTTLHAALLRLCAQPDLPEETLRQALLKLLSDQSLPPAAPHNWPERLPLSVRHLVQHSLALDALLHDPAAFTRLTSLHDTSRAAQEDIGQLRTHLHGALAHLMDLTAYETPEQPFPQLHPAFEFSCANMSYARFDVSYPVKRSADESR